MHLSLQTDYGLRILMCLAAAGRQMSVDEIARGYGCETLGIRSEHIVVDNDNPTWKGEVVHAENLGSDNYLFVDIGAEEPVLVRQEGKTAIPWGAHIGIRPLEENLHRFDAKGTPIR